jgi:sorting nexin-1/2
MDNDDGMKSAGGDVLVISPINQGEGRNMHVTYLVVTGGIEIRRRYSDFQWLYNRLLTEDPGSFVPIIPHKRTAFAGEAKFSEEFTEERRVNLQRFLKGVFHIPKVKKLCPSLKVFLTVSADHIDAAKKAVEHENPSLVSTKDNDEDETNAVNMKKKVGNLFAKAKTVAQTKMGSELETTKDESLIAELKMYINRVELHVKELLMATEHLVKATSDKMCALNDLGVKVAEWKFSRDDFLDNAYGPEGRLLDDHQEIPKMMSAVAHFSSEIGSLMEKQVAEERNKFEQGLKELALNIQAFKVALKMRKRLQYALTAKNQQIQNQKKQMENPKMNNFIDKQSAELHTLEKSASVLKVKFEECSSRILSESSRARPILEFSMKQCLVDYANIQIEYGNLVNKSWRKLMPTLRGGEKGVEAELQGLTTIKLSESGEAPVMPSAPPPPVPSSEDEEPEKDTDEGN